MSLQSELEALIREIVVEELRAAVTHVGTGALDGHRGDTRGACGLEPATPSLQFSCGVVATGQLWS